jgi:hypothetical protein
MVMYGGFSLEKNAGCGSMWYNKDTDGNTNCICDMIQHKPTGLSVGEKRRQALWLVRRKSN